MIERNVTALFQHHVLQFLQTMFQFRDKYHIILDQIFQKIRKENSKLRLFFIACLQHPELEGFLQVYDRATHSWSDVEENYFWQFQEKKKQMLGADYQAPIRI